MIIDLGSANVLGFFVKCLARLRSGGPKNRSPDLWIVPWNWLPLFCGSNHNRGPENEILVRGSAENRGMHSAKRALVTADAQQPRRRLQSKAGVQPYYGLTKPRWKSGKRPGSVKTSSRVYRGGWI